jgi:hypothetical protein
LFEFDRWLAKTDDVALEKSLTNSFQKLILNELSYDRGRRKKNTKKRITKRDNYFVLSFFEGNT